MIETSTDHKDKLVSDLRVVIADIEELLLVTASHVGESAMELRKRVQARLQQMKAELAHLQESAVAKAKAGSQATDEFVPATVAGAYRSGLREARRARMAD